MKKLLVLPLMLGLLAPSFSQAADRFEEKDFNWDPFFSLYKRVIVVGVNKMAREKPECANLDPKSLQYNGGTPDDPVFSVTCGEGDHISHPSFSKADITGDPGSNVPLEDKEGN